MSEYKVSPGPWEIEHVTDAEGNHYWWVNTKYIEPAVAKCFSPAYAQIISAIPDMYESLERALVILKSNAEMIAEYGVVDEELELAIEISEQALAKARGESHDR